MSKVNDDIISFTDLNNDINNDYDYGIMNRINVNNEYDMDYDIINDDNSYDMVDLVDDLNDTSNINNIDDNNLNDKLMIGGKKKKKTNEFKYQEYRMMTRPIPEEGEEELDNNKIPIARQIVIKDILDITKIAVSPVLHNDIDYAKFSLGFHHWIHASKNKTDAFNQFIGKKKVYLVLNGYERHIDDYENSISNISNLYFGLGSNKDKKPNILSGAFYKLWEIFYYYDLIDLQEKSFRSAHLAESPESFIQATMFIRDMYSKNSKNDKYYGITIHSESDDKATPELEREFITYYEKEKPQRFFMHKTYDRKSARMSKDKDDGDLTNTKTILLFKKDIETKVDLITGDGGFDWDNENIQEQESAILIYGQILTALNIQKKGGNFVLKMFEMYTKISLKFIILLKYFYEEVHIIKPLTSRESNSERYLVCKKFKYEEKEISSILKQMEDGLDHINKNNVQNKFLADIFPELIIQDEIILNILSINIQLSNRQFKVVNKMIEYIEGSNYHGELYMKYKNRQIDLSKFWIDTFINGLDTKEHDFKKITAKASKILSDAEKYQNIEYDKFVVKLQDYNIKNKSSDQLSRTKNKKKFM